MIPQDQIDACQRDGVVLIPGRKSHPFPGRDMTKGHMAGEDRVPMCWTDGRA